MPVDDEDVQRQSGGRSYQKGKVYGKSTKVTSSDGDYYEWMAMAKDVRPISIAEGLEWSSMSILSKLFWWIAACMQLMMLTMFDFRTDRLQQRNYMRHHWVHYSGTVLFTITVMITMFLLLNSIK